MNQAERNFEKKVSALDKRVRETYGAWLDGRGTQADYLAALQDRDDFVREQLNSIPGA